MEDSASEFCGPKAQVERFQSARLEPAQGVDRGCIRHVGVRMGVRVSEKDKGESVSGSGWWRNYKSVGAGSQKKE